MNFISAFQPGMLPALEMDAFTKKINKFIREYNCATQVSNKIELLKKIQTQIKTIDYTYKPSDLAKSPGYLAVHAQLFKAIQYEYASLKTSPEQYASTLSELIANMSPDKVEKLLSILIKGNKAVLTDPNSELKRIYRSTDRSAEARNFNNFLSHHEISYLGGKNSKNFKVQPLNGQGEPVDPMVLKIENRLDLPKSAEAHLRDKLGNRLTPIYAERQAACLESGKKVLRPIMITKFCHGGSGVEHGKMSRETTELAQNTQIVFQQMAKAMLDIQKAGCMFPDAKLSNWLIDKNNQVRIADTKSFVFTDKNGQYSKNLPKNTYYKLLYTKRFIPPEFANLDLPKSADAIHAYLLGKNLYAYTSGIFGMDDGKTLDFNKPFFKSPQGIECRKLIEELIRPNPQHRLPLENALDRLMTLNYPEYATIFTQLKALQFGKGDKLFEQYILDKKHAISTTTDPEQIKKIFQELDQTVTTLNTGAVKEVKTIIDNFRTRSSGFFTVGMKNKAERIEKNMANLSIEERCNFFSSKKSEDVMKALASHRHLGKSNKTYLRKTGEIDTKKAAKSYKHFKDKFQSLMPSDEEKQKQHPYHNKTPTK
jgi:hypothetical protein